MRRIVTVVLLCFNLIHSLDAAENAVHEYKTTVFKEGDDLFLIQEDGTKRKINAVGGQARKSIDRALADSGYEKYVRYTDTGSRLVLQYVDDEPLLTDEEKKRQKQEKLEACAETGRKELSEFAPEGNGFFTSRGPAEIRGLSIVQKLCENTGRDRSDTRQDVITGRLASGVPGEFYDVMPMEQYVQTVRVECASATDAQNVFLCPLPLYNGYLLAYTCRWDDNNPDGDSRNCRIGAKAGVFATCFLNGKDFGWPMDESKTVTGEEIKSILATGCSIGNHSQNHNANGDLKTLPNNDQFREVYLPRAEREAQGDCLIMTVAPPHNKFGDFVTMENWNNAGHYAFINDGPGARGYSANNVVIVRGDAEPLAVFSAFHATFLNNEKPMAVAVEEWKAVGADSRIWKCTFNQYAAYRYQYQHTAVGRKIEGRTAVFTLYRPELLSLNDSVSLTFEVRGVTSDAIQNLSADNAKIEPLSGTAAKRFNLLHDSDRFLPERIGLITGTDNSEALIPEQEPADFPGIYAACWEAADGLHLTVDNRSGQSLTNIAVTCRLPNGWSPCVSRTRIQKIDSKSRWSGVVKATPPVDVALRRGKTTLGFQLDFLMNNRSGRLHIMNWFGGTTDK